MVRWTLYDTLAFLLLLSLLLPSLLIMFIPSTFKRPVSSWKALNLRKTLLMASSVRLKPLNCSRLPCVYAQETLTFLLTQKKTCVKNYVQKEDRKSGSAGMPRPISYAVFCLKKKNEPQHRLSHARGEHLEGDQHADGETVVAHHQQLADAQDGERHHLLA